MGKIVFSFDDGVHSLLSRCRDQMKSIAVTESMVHSAQSDPSLPRLLRQVPVLHKVILGPLTPVRRGRNDGSAVSGEGVGRHPVT